MHAKMLKYLQRRKMSEGQKKSPQKKSAVEKVVTEQEEYIEGDLVIRWYHIASLVVVLALVVTAGVKFFGRYDMSLINASRQLRAYYGCTENVEDPNYRYFGVEDGEMFSVKDGKLKQTDNREDAILELGVINGKPSFKVKQDGEWVEDSLMFGEEGTYVIDSSLQCKPGIKIHLSV